jgi:Zn-dependent protease
MPVHTVTTIHGARASRLHVTGRKPLIPLGRWAGIEVGADGTWLIVFALVTATLSRQFTSGDSGLGMHRDWALGLATSLLFFLSIVLHEFGHSLVAIRLGVPVRSITLFIFGGVALLGGEPRRPRDELLIASAGPVVSLALALGYGALAHAIAFATPVEEALVWLSRVNFSLFAFNLIPGFPLDGGRVLRAALWAWKGDFDKATGVAAGVGTLVAFAFMTLGVVIALADGQFWNGLWLAALGWFLLTAARGSLAQTMVSKLMGSVMVRDAMTADYAALPPSISLRDVVERYIMRQGQRSFLVTQDGNLLGVISVREIRAVPQEDWSTTSVQGAMVRRSAIEPLAPQTTLLEALAAMDEAGLNILPVESDEHLVGALSRDQVFAVIRTQREFRV